MYEGEHVLHTTDLSLASLAETLSQTSPPLLTFDPSGTPEPRDLRGVVTLTPIGRSVLAGERDRVSTCGIDRWLGGVHLQSGGRVWRWDDARQRVT
jgi:hypothetical protein